MKSKILILFVAMGLSGTANMVCGQTTAVPDTLSKYILTPKAPDTPPVSMEQKCSVSVPVPISFIRFRLPVSGL